MQDEIFRLAKDSWKLRDLDQDELFTLLGIYSLYDKEPEEVLSVFRMMSGKPPKEGPIFPSEEALSPKGVVDTISTFFSYGKDLWNEYAPILAELLCKSDGTPKHRFDLVEDLRDLIILIASSFSIGYGIAACLLLLLYKRGYPAFCSQQLGASS